MLHQVLVSRLIGGAAVVAIRLSAAAKRRGMACVAWVPGEGPAWSALSTEQVETQFYDLDGVRGTRLAQLIACARMAAGLASLERPLVHVHNPTVFGLLRPALRIARAKVVVHFQIEPPAEEIAWTLKSPPDHIITCAEYIRQQLRGAMTAETTRAPVTTIPNAVDLERFRPGDRTKARDRLGLQTARPVILMLANLSPHKGQPTALRALADLSRHGVDAEVWLAGEDRTGERYETHLAALAAELGVADRVRFLGFRLDGPDLLQAADAFVLPSTHEGLPLSVLEAQASKIPVIGSTIAGIREIVDDGRTGFLVSADDHAGYADRLARLFGDNAMKNRITDEAAAQVRRDYSWAVVEERTFAIYRSLLDSDRPGRQSTSV